MPTRLHCYDGAGYLHFITIRLICATNSRFLHCAIPFDFARGLAPVGMTRRGEGTEASATHNKTGEGVEDVL